MFGLAYGYICKGLRKVGNIVLYEKTELKESLPANCVAIGVPVKVIKYLDAFRNSIREFISLCAA